MSQTAKGTGRRTAILVGVAIAAGVTVFAPQISNIFQGVASREGASCPSAPRAMGKVLIAEAHQPLPFVALLAEDDRTVELSGLLAGGKGAVINLWATWCAPCVREMPDLDRLHAVLAPDGIKVIAISEDRAAPAVPRQFFATNGIGNLDVLIDPNGAFARRINVRGLPTTLLVGADGAERARVEGVAKWDTPEAVAFIRRCLGVPPDG